MYRKIASWEGFLDNKIEELEDNPIQVNEISNIKDLLKRQKDREYCSFEFRNNLASKKRIEYLKISHVLEGREAFVYETTYLDNGGRFYIADYAIGINLDDTSDSTYSIKSEEIDKKNKKKNIMDNTYDRLYVHFIIEDQLYHQSYDQFLNNEIFDLFSSDGKLDRAYLSLLDIKVCFDPLHNDHTKEEFKLIISVTTPIKDRINLIKS